MNSGNDKIGLIGITPNSSKLNVWYGIMTKPCRPFYYHRSYTLEDKLGRFFILQLQDIPNIIFQLEGEVGGSTWPKPPHWSMGVRNRLDKYFPKRWIWRYGSIGWPVRSPIFIPCNFFMWGFMKDKAYYTKIHSLN